MPDPDQKVDPNATDLLFRRSDLFKSIFSNLYKTRIGNGECTILFSKITHQPSAAAEGNIIEEQVEVIITWPQLKMLAIHLNSLVASIEAELGPIPIPNIFAQGIAARGPLSQLDAVRSLGLTTVIPEVGGTDERSPAPRRARKKPE